MSINSAEWLNDHTIVVRDDYEHMTPNNINDLFRYMTQFPPDITIVTYDSLYGK